VTLLVPLLAAVLLSLERICYVFAWHRPEAFRRMGCRVGLGRDGVTALERAFYAFKVVQVAVCAGWCLWYSRGEPLAMSSSDEAILLGGLLIVAGQTLNFLAAWRLGRIGMFYGVRFGHRVARCDKFPYSVLAHPQYFGTVTTIWGVFLALRFPHPDWVVLPFLESVYYLVASYLESDRVFAPRRASERRAGPVSRAPLS
jgi:methylene-fatty-acyl-phospholipid synthase